MTKLLQLFSAPSEELSISDYADLHKGPFCDEHLRCFHLNTLGVGGETPKVFKSKWGMVLKKAM